MENSILLREIQEATNSTPEATNRTVEFTSPKHEKVATLLWSDNLQLLSLHPVPSHYSVRRNLCNIAARWRVIFEAKSPDDFDSMSCPFCNDPNEWISVDMRPTDYWATQCPHLMGIENTFENRELKWIDNETKAAKALDKKRFRSACKRVAIHQDNLPGIQVERTGKLIAIYAENLEQFSNL